MEDKDIEYYREHTDELPDDPDMLEQLYTEAEAGEPQDDDKPVDEDVDANPDDKDADKEDEGKPTDDKQVLKAKDGVNEIPYSVLEKTRAELAESQKASEDADRRIADMQAELDALKVKEEPDEKPKSSVDELEEEYGDDDVITKTAREQAQRTETLEDRTAKAEAELASLKQEREDKEIAEHQKEVDAAIDANPTMKAWREDPERWEDALAMNEVLMRKEEWQSKPLDEITTEIVRRLGGPIKTDPAPKVDVDTSTTPVPHSLSDIPAGDAPSQTASEELSRLSNAEFSARYEACKNDDERNALMSAAGM